MPVQCRWGSGGETDLRISIRHEEIKEGVVFRNVWHDVCVTVDFTQEERQIIVERRLTGHVLLERMPAGVDPDDNPDWYHLRVGHLLERKPDRHRTANPSDAKAYEARLLAALQAMKDWLASNADPGEDKVIEL